jgi:DNA-binding transcriptional regulator YiaG
MRNLHGHAVSNSANRSRAVAHTGPTPAEIRTARETAGLTQTQAATLLYKTTRVWQMREAGDRAMDPAFWELFCIKLAAHNGRA